MWASVYVLLFVCFFSPDFSSGFYLLFAVSSFFHTHTHFTVHPQATHRGRVRIRRIAPGSAACRAGILPGYILKYGEAEIVTYSDFEAAVEEHEAAGATSVTLTVAVDIADGSWVEAHGLTKAEHINGRRGIVEGINVKPNGGGSAVHVKFSEHGLIWMRPSNLIFLASEGSDGEDAASTAISSSRCGPQSLGGTVRSGASVCSKNTEAPHTRSHTN